MGERSESEKRSASSVSMVSMRRASAEELSCR